MTMQLFDNIQDSNINKNTRKPRLTLTLPSLAMVGIASLSLIGCATTSNIQPDYVSPNTFQGYDCNQLAQEYNRITSYMNQAQNESFNLASSGIGIGLHGNRHGVYPSVTFGMKNTNGQSRKEKLARLHGERDAVVQYARMQSCNFVVGKKVYGE